MFIPIKSTDGAMTPFEYIEAAAGTYQVGQLLGVTDGKLAAIAADQATTPPYVCMQSGTVAASPWNPFPDRAAASPYFCRTGSPARRCPM